MSDKPQIYTAGELIDLLKLRQGGMTLSVYSKEIGISIPMLSDIFRGSRSVGNEKVLAYLAPKGKQFTERKTWVLDNK